MTVVLWGLLPAAPALAPLDEEMIVQVAIQDGPNWTIIERAVVDTATDQLGQAASWSWRVQQDSPGLAALIAGRYFARGPQSPIVVVFQDGQVTRRGYVANPELQLVDGWATFTCYDLPGHLTHALIGGVAHNYLGDTMTLGDGTNGWLPVNSTAIVTGGGAGVGPGIHVTERRLDDLGHDTRGNPYRSIHKNVRIGSRDHDWSAHTSAYMILSKRTQHPETVKARTVIWPLDVTWKEANRTKIVLDWQLPGNLPLGRTFFVQGPDIALSRDREYQIRTGVWAPRRESAGTEQQTITVGAGVTSYLLEMFGHVHTFSPTAIADDIAAWLATVPGVATRAAYTTPVLDSFDFTRDHASITVTIDTFLVHTITLDQYYNGTYGLAATIQAAIGSDGFVTYTASTITIRSNGYGVASSVEVAADDNAQIAGFDADDSDTGGGPGNVNVTGPAGGPYTVTFLGDLLAVDMPTMAATGTGGTVTITPLGAGAVLVSVAMLTVDDGLGVAGGDNAANMVAVILEEGVRQVGLPIGVVVDGDSSYVFAADNRLNLRDHPDVMGSVHTYDAYVDWRYDPDTNTIRVAGLHGLGTQRTDLVFSNDEGGGHRTLTVAGPSDQNVANRVLAQAPDGDATRFELVETMESFVREPIPPALPTSKATWTQMAQAQPGTFPKGLPKFADQLLAPLLRPGNEYTVWIGPPPGGRTPLDWLIDGPTWTKLRPGDKCPQRTVFGAFDDGSPVEIVSLDPDYKTATLNGTVRAVA